LFEFRFQCFRIEIYVHRSLSCWDKIWGELKPHMRLIYFVLFGLGRLTKLLFDNDSANFVRTLGLLVYVYQYLFAPLLLRYWCPVYPFNELSLSGGLFQHLHINSCMGIHLLMFSKKYFYLFFGICWVCHCFSVSFVRRFWTITVVIHQYLVLVPLGYGIVLFGCDYDFWVSLLSPLYTKPISCIQISLCLMFCIKVSSSSIKKLINYHLLSQGSAQYLQT
jgi:hypothetical protein